MDNIEKNWILYNQQSGEYSEMFENEEDLCITDKDTVYSITDDFVVYKRKEADTLAQELWECLLPSLNEFDDLAADQPLIKVVAFRHDDNGDWTRAVSVEWSVIVNKLGYGVVVRRDLLERLNIPYYKA